MIRLGVSGALTGVLERLVELQSFSAKDRFRTLLKRSPHILQLVPHKYLASYLRVDPDKAEFWDINQNIYWP